MKKLLAAVALAAMALPAQAATIVYGAENLVGNQNWTGTLGLNFQVNSAVLVTALGVFDSGSDGIAEDLFVGIFNSGGTLLTSETIVGGTGGPGNYKFIAIAGLILNPGTYQLASWGYDSFDPNYNSGFSGLPGPITFDTVGGRLTAFNATYSDEGTGGTFAALTEPPNSETRYGAGNFIAEAVVAAVPEPATWGMMILGFGMAGYGLRRRSAASTA